MPTNKVIFILWICIYKTQDIFRKKLQIWSTGTVLLFLPMGRSIAKLHQGQPSFVLSESILPFWGAELTFSGCWCCLEKWLFSFPKNHKKLGFWPPSKYLGKVIYALFHTDAQVLCLRNPSFFPILHQDFLPLLKSCHAVSKNVTIWYFLGSLELPLFPLYLLYVKQLACKKRV